MPTLNNGDLEPAITVSLNFPMIFTQGLQRKRINLLLQSLKLIKIKKLIGL